jgi:hypothetical protein
MNDPARVEKTLYKGWRVYRLTNGIVTLLVAPDIGGRAIQLELGGQEFFFVNPDLAGKVLPEEQNNPRTGWANYGGDKVWPAPQGQSSDSEWPGPPDYILEGSRFTAEVVKDTPSEVAVRLTSPADPRTGIQFARTFHVYAGTTRIQVDQVMRNISRRRVRWSIWHVAQHNGADARDPSRPNPELFIYVPLNPRSVYPDGYYVSFGDVRNPSYELIDGGRMLRIHYLYRVAKIGADSGGGWIAVVNGQKHLCFTERFPYFPGAEYPDRASVEAWNNGPGTSFILNRDFTISADLHKTPYYIEAEILSPLATLDPGEEYRFPVTWSVTRAPNPVREVGWAGVTSEPLSAATAGNQITLKGVFGVFAPGTAVAVFYNRLGEEVTAVPLQSLDPREVFRLEKSLPRPADAFRVSLQVHTAEGENLGILGNALLP